MIKHIMINRFSDGLIFCQTNQDYHNTQLQSIKMKVKNYHREVTPYSKQQHSSYNNNNKTNNNNTNTNTNNNNSNHNHNQFPQIHQIQNPKFNIYYKISSYVIFTIITQQGYPLKLISIFIDLIINSFFDQAKTILGTNDLQSRLEGIQGSHYFIKFDRIIKQKKKQFDDPKSVKNSQRMKKSLQSIQQIMKQNMLLIDNRHKQLLQTQSKAKQLNQQSKKFQRKTNKLKWNIWMKKNLVYIVLVIAVIMLGWLVI